MALNRRWFVGSGIVGVARCAALISILAMSCAVQAQDFPTLSVDAYATIVANPETPTAGATAADVTIVEFFDYNCPICRQMHPQVAQLLREDAHVRVLYKEWPVFGASSEYAARAAIAASWQGKYLAAHDALIASRRELDEIADVDDVLQAAGVDLGKLEHDRKRHAAQIEATLARVAAEAEKLGLQGTPGFLVGRQFIPRSMSLPLLRSLVAHSRSAAK